VDNDSTVGEAWKEYVFPVSEGFSAVFQTMWLVQGKESMRRTPRSLADAREELVQIQEEFTRLQKRIEAVRDSVADSLVRLFGEERPAFTGLQEEAFIDRIAERVVARLKARPNAPVQSESRYVREKEAALFLGVSVFTIRSWRSRGEPCGPLVTRMSKMVMHFMNGLEQFMELRTTGGGKEFASVKARWKAARVMGLTDDTHAL